MRRLGNFNDGIMNFSLFYSMKTTSKLITDFQTLVRRSRLVCYCFALIDDCLGVHREMKSMFDKPFMFVDLLSVVRFKKGV